MTTESQTIEKQEPSIEELEAMLKERKEAQRKKREKEKAKYEKERDQKVNTLIAEASDLCSQLEAFKKKCHTEMQDQHVKLTDYGMIRKNSQGGFSITHSNEQYRVVRRRDTTPQWDERGEKAIMLIKEFLHDSVKKRDKDMFEVLMTFLERNKAGDLEYSKVMDLLAHRNKFSDERWSEGLELLEQSFSLHFKGYNYEFKHKDEHGSWENLQLNFSSL